MSYCLRNEKNPGLTLILTDRTWYQVLELAEEHGWNPLGTVLPIWMSAFDEWLSRGEAYPEGLGGGSYAPLISRLVLLEDALNLADALESAFLAHEPAPIYDSTGIHRTEWDDYSVNGARPAVGVVLMLVEFCSQGAFWVERFGEF